MHLACLRAVLKVGETFLTSCHKAACALAAAPTQEVSKARLLALSLTEEDVIRPPDSTGSYKAAAAAATPAVQQQQQQPQ